MSVTLRGGVVTAGTGRRLVQRPLDGPMSKTVAAGGLRRDLK